MEFADSFLKETAIDLDELREVIKNISQESLLYEILSRICFARPKSIRDKINEKIALAEIENLNALTFSISVSKLIPRDVAERYAVVPVKIINTGHQKVIILAAKDPYDMQALREIRTFITADIKILMIKSKDEQILSAIDTIYSPIKEIRSKIKQVPEVLLKPICLITLPAGVLQEEVEELSAPVKVKEEKPAVKIKEVVPIKPEHLKAEKVPAEEEKAILSNIAQEIYKRFTKMRIKSASPIKAIKISDV